MVEGMRAGREPAGRVLHGGGSFAEELRASLRGAPWYAISVAFHVVLVLVLFNLTWSESTRTVRKVIQASPIAEALPPLPDPPDLPPEICDDRDLEVVDDPVVSEDEVSDFESDFETLSPVACAFESNLDFSPIGTGPGGVRGDGPPGRPRRRASGSPTEVPVENGLLWLAQHQDDDGSWDCDEFWENCRQNVCDGAGGALNDVGVTGLSLLAFLGAGHTCSEGRYQQNVKKGLHWLATQQDREDGCIGPKTGQQFLYGHAIATLALVDGFHLSQTPLLRKPAMDALAFVSRSRSPYRAWRYDYPPAGDSDVSLSGWMLFALFAGKDAGLPVDDAAIRAGMDFVEAMTDPGTGRTGYHERGSYPAREEADRARWPNDRSESMTAVAALCRVFAGEDPKDSQRLKQAEELCRHLPPKWDEDAGTIDFYYWYYGTYAMWQIGGRTWKDWQRSLLDSVVSHQRKSGDEAGSWDPQVDPWGDDGGRVYATAINVLCLEVYYRYARVFGGR